MGCGSSHAQGAANLRKGLTFLPVDDPNPEKRAKEITQNREFYYKWKYAIPGINPYLERVPIVEKSDDTAQHKLDTFTTFVGSNVKLQLNKTLEFFKGVFSDQKPFEGYTDIFHGATIPRPKVWEHWNDDEEFARQRMVGCNPTLLRRVEGVDSPVLRKMPVTDADVAGVLPDGYTIRRLIDEKRLFMCDYEQLQDILSKCPPERYSTAPIILFFSHPGRQNMLLPLAIQLDQDPTKSLIFTPRDPKGTWMIAKLHCQVADANLHEVEAHLYATHWVMEAVYVSMRRNLHPTHPLAAWLQENFFFTIHINVSARQNLITPEGPVPVLMSMGYGGTVALFQSAAARWDWKRYDIPLSIQRRGLDDPVILPQHYWRDDALRLWACVGKFVENMVDCIYHSDTEVANDKELQAWIKELTAPVGETGCGFRGLPLDEASKKMLTLAHLKKFCTMVLYTASAGHSAVNNGQYDYLGFVPNSPGTFKIPPPKTKVDVNMATIAGAMPNADKTVLQIGFVHLLSNQTDDPLGTYDGAFFKRPDIGGVLENFQRDLNQLSDEIRKRNALIGHPYTYLDPRQIAQGIAI